MQVWERNGTAGDQVYETCLLGNGEDPYCSNSIPLLETNIKDHLFYMGVEKVDCKL